MNIFNIFFNYIIHKVNEQFIKLIIMYNKINFESETYEY